MSKIKEMSLSSKIFIAMIVGGILGIVIGEPMVQIKVIGDIWVRLIQMIIVPMVLVTIIKGIAGQQDAKSVGRIGGKIALYYLVTTVVAAIIGILVATFFKPGLGFVFEATDISNIGATEAVTVSGFLTSFFSKNMFKAFTDANLVQIIVIAIILGIGILKIKDSEVKAGLYKAFDYANEMIFSVIRMIMNFAPIGVFCLMAASFGKYGAAILGPIAGLAGTFYVGVLLQIFFVYALSTYFIAGVSPIRFIKDTAELWIYTLSTCSSTASIPVNLKINKEKFNVPSHISGFTIPLGSQVNHDGNAMLFSCIVLFVAQATGMPITIGLLVKMILLSTVISSSGGGIPGSGIVLIIVMINSFNLPTEIIGIMAAFYRVFDMGITTNNCLGDLAGTVCVAQSEKKYLAQNKKDQLVA